MKKYILIASAGMLITAGVAATALNNGKKKTTHNTSEKSCPYHKCSKGSNVACY